MSKYMVYILSFMCGYTGITTKVTVGHIKYIQKVNKTFKYIKV